MSDFDFIGHMHARPDAADKATGRAVYVQDLVRPGMLHGKIKFSEHAHAKIVHIDTSRAERLPGVRAVLTGYNTKEVRIGFLRDNFALKRDRVRQFRDEVAAVAAIDPDIAQEAVDLIRVEYEPLPAVFTPEEAMKEGAILVHELDATGRPRTDNLLALRVHHETGDLAAALTASKHIAEGEYSTPIIQQSCMGTSGCIAELHANGHLTMWAKTQIPFLAQRDFVRALESMGLPDRNVRVIVPTLGGAFGTGLDTHAYEFIAILLSQRTARPVKILYTREEEFAFLSPRQPVRVRISQGCDAEGKLTFRKMDVLQDNGAYTSWGATYPTVMLIPATSLYRVPTIYFDAKIVYTHNTYCQAMRGYGNPELTWPIESTIDELAEAVGMDPFEFRMRNRNLPMETTPMGLRVTTCGLGECLQVAAQKLSWTEKRGKKQSVRRGVGMASLVHVGGSGRIYRSDGGGVILKLDDYGNVNVSYGGVEMGQGLHSALALTVAEALGVKPEKVFVNQTDTNTCPWDVGTHASRGAFVGCNAAIAAAKKLRKRLMPLVAEVYPKEASASLRQYKMEHPGYVSPELDWAAICTPDSLELSRGEVFPKDIPAEPWMRVDFGKILRTLHFRGTLGQVFTEEAYYEPPSELPNWENGVGNMSATYAYGVQGAEVEVDEETGEVKIVRMVSAHDVGQVLNPQTLAGQVYGGLAQGVGFALYEQVHSVGGQIRNPSFTDYKIPTVGEMSFPIDIEFVQTNDEYGPFGSKGVGEPGLVPTAPAIANAIYDAIGVRIRDLPITREKIIAELRKRKK